MTSHKTISSLTFPHDFPFQSFNASSTSAVTQFQSVTVTRYILLIANWWLTKEDDGLSMQMSNKTVSSHYFVLLAHTSSHKSQKLG